jgi:hypothetical protein
VESSAGSLHGLFFDPEDGGHMYLRKVWLTFNGLHGIISQELVVFITTAVRTANPLTQWYSTFIVDIPPDIISLQLCTLKVVGV